MQRKSGRVAVMVALAIAVLAGVGVGVVLVNRGDPALSAAGQSTGASPPAQSPTGSAEASAALPTFPIPKPDQPNTATPLPDLTAVFGRVRSGVVRVLA
ncbi:MAG TPA: hypothetical protein VGW74_13730, partial [Propionibacteriaceae bacterium]|nr:hypothetical protein [Propionibacteriaceae bacterium]